MVWIEVGPNRDFESTRHSSSNADRYKKSNKEVSGPTDHTSYQEVSHLKCRRLSEGRLDIEREPLSHLLPSISFASSFCIVHIRVQDLVYRCGFSTL
jgi:hypothetical protein